MHVKLLRRQRGFSTIVAVSAALAIATLSFWAFAHLMASSRRAVRVKNTQLQAQYLAVELLELFRSMTNDQLNLYLATQHPQPQQLCAHINILDHAHNTLINPDSTADLPQEFKTAGRILSRYFKVDVVEIATLARQDGVCALNRASAAQYYAFPSPRTQAFLVTVFVDYMGVGDAIQTERLTALITDG
jgi:hypothetical protein